MVKRNERERDRCSASLLPLVSVCFIYKRNSHAAAALNCWDARAHTPKDTEGGFSIFFFVIAYTHLLGVSSIACLASFVQVVLFSACVRAKL